jgi:proton-dependent oligopeptide transporter, POT family
VQTGPYVLIAISEIFASITGLEYAFTKGPKNMRSLVMAVFLFTSAISSALGEAFVSLSTDPLLVSDVPPIWVELQVLKSYLKVWNYGAMAVLAAVGGVLFYFNFRHLDKAEDELNDLGEGHLASEKH